MFSGIRSTSSIFKEVSIVIMHLCVVGHLAHTGSENKENNFDFIRTINITIILIMIVVNFSLVVINLYVYLLGRTNHNPVFFRLQKYERIKKYN